MSSVSVFEFTAQSRVKPGSSESRRIRRKGDVPAVIYGAHQKPQMITLNHNDVIKHLAHEAVYSHILNVTVDGKTEQAILKGVQRHPAKVQILHLDFMRIDMSEMIKVHVPLHFTNEHTSIGIKKGGMATHSVSDVEVICLPANLPEYIEVDMSAMDIGDSIHLSDLKLPNGVQLTALAQGTDHDLAVVSMTAKNKE